MRAQVPNSLLTFFFIIAFLSLVQGLQLSVNNNRNSGDDTSPSWRRRFFERESTSTERSVSSSVEVAVVLPHSTFKEREYRKRVQLSVSEQNEQLLEQNSRLHLSATLDMLQPIPSPTEVLHKLCQSFLQRRTSVIIYLTSSQRFGRHSMASQYFLQLAQYMRLPVIGFNADNSAFETIRASGTDRRLHLQLAPSIRHQARAIHSLLTRYQWSAFTIVTGTIAGHAHFEQVMRELAGNLGGQVVDSVTVRSGLDVSKLTRSDSRVFVLYSTHAEARSILKEATRLGLSGENYVWIVTQSAIGSVRDTSADFPLGMLGVHFRADLLDAVPEAMAVVADAVQQFGERQEIRPPANLSCEPQGDAIWREGNMFFELLSRTAVASAKSSWPPIAFDEDGNRLGVRLTLLNLQRERGPHASLERKLRWEEIGSWQSWSFQTNVSSITSTSSWSRSWHEAVSYSYRGQLSIKDIVWADGALTPPLGRPARRFLRVSFLEEDPYVMLSDVHTCASRKGVICYLSNNETSNATSNSRCCSGFSVDLLLKLSEELSFDFQMRRVRDGKWGGVEKGQWNGLVAALMHDEADIVMTSLKINSGRERVIDFSVPFLETGITILVAKRTGIISPTAFLEPFDTISWIVVAVVALQAAALLIFAFELLAPDGYNMGPRHPAGRFSLMRALWLSWAVFFQANVNVDCPRGFTARFMAHTWALFALIFLAIYTANLAAFMITREEFHNLSGLDDRRLNNPRSAKPAFTFGTIPNGNTDDVMRNNFPDMHAYMKKYSRSTVKEGAASVKYGELDAFLYDATVLDYLVGQDDDCNLLTVGAWYAMTGYGVGFPKASKWIPAFNERLMRYRENGDLERMHRFWFTGVCDPTKRTRTSSKPLALMQFMSAFLLLGMGVLLSIFFLVMEHLYFALIKPYLQPRLPQSMTNALGLVSLSLARSLRNDENIEMRARCANPQCSDRLRSYYSKLIRANLAIEILAKRLRQIDERALDLLLHDGLGQEVEDDDVDEEDDVAMDNWQRQRRNFDLETVL